MTQASMIRRGMLTLCVAWSLYCTTAQADQIVIGKAQSGNALRVYIKRASGCSNFAFDRGHYGDAQLYTSDEDDIIVVHDGSTTIRWCGWTIRPLDADSEAFTIIANAGSDIIWGGHSSLRRYTRFFGSTASYLDDYKPDYIYTGSAHSAYGGKGDDVIFVNQPGTLAFGEDGDDLFCTQVDEVYMNMQASRLVGDSGTDGLYGPDARLETTVDNTNTEGDRQRCTLTYLSVVSQVLAMLSVTGR